MNNEFAWFLGTLISDGSIVRPTRVNRGDERHISYCLHYKDYNMLVKIAKILNTRALVRKYPQYQSPQCQLNVYDRKDIIEKYDDIKESVPKNVDGYERHLIRGIVDGDGCLSYRENRKSFRFNIINQNRQIIEWCSHAISRNLNIAYKEPKYKEKDHIYIIEWEGRIARLIIWWLYHGNIDNMVLDRKHLFYKEQILKNRKFLSKEEEFIFAIGAVKEKGKILPCIQAQSTLEWCHIIQKQLSYKTQPIFSNKGQTKYYYLYIPN